VLLVLELIAVLELRIELVRLLLVIVEDDVEEGLLLLLLDTVLELMLDELGMLLVALAEETVLESPMALLGEMTEFNVDCGWLLDEDKELLGDEDEPPDDPCWESEEVVVMGMLPSLLDVMVVPWITEEVGVCCT
jgi:hypothetical protein